MADDGGLLLQLADHLGKVVCHLSNSLVRERLGVLVGLLDRLRIVRPAGCQRTVASFLEERLPAIPAAWQEPEPMNEDDGSEPLVIRLFDLLGLVLIDARHVQPPQLSAAIVNM